MDSDLLDYMIEYKRQRDGVAPSIREMARRLRCGHSSVYQELDRLERLQLIQRGPGARNISIVGGRWIPPTE